MCRKVKSNSPFSANCVIRYTIPTLHLCKEPFVALKALDPVSGKLKTKKYMLTRFGNRKAVKMMAAQMIANLTVMLQQGWNPFIDNMNSRSLADVKEVLRMYEEYVRAMGIKGAMKQKTVQDYLSRLTILREYIASMRVPVNVISQLDKVFVSDFLDYIVLDRDLSARTRNNYKIWLSSLFEWLKQKQSVSENYAQGIPAVKEDAKQRTALTESELKRLSAYLADTDKHYLLAVMMEYYTFVRPSELVQIKLSNISIEKQSLFVPGAISKNRRDGLVGINAHILRLMNELHIFDCPGDFYLFGKDFTPSARRADSRIFREKFVAVRQALGLDATKQFYSLKDSGIRDLANAEGIVVARDQARHTDIATTNRYLVGDGLSVHEETKKFRGNL